MIPAFPFKALIRERPYPVTGLTTARWGFIKPRVVTLAQLTLTQDGVQILPLFGLTDRESDGFPHVVAWRGEQYLEDGHHRVVRAALRDRVTAMWMRVFTREDT